MNKYKVGDKIVLTVSDVNEKAYYSYYVFNNNDLILWEPSTDKYAEPLSTYTEPLETKIENLKKKLKRWVEKCTNQSTEITRLLAENEKLKAENGNVIWEIEQAFDRGCNAAWELARKIAPTAGGLSSSELVEIFNAFLPRDILSENTYPEAAAKVAEWEKAKAKPQKTMMQDFLEKFPKAELNSQGTPYGICPSYLGYKTPKCNFGCVECWNRPLEQIGEE